MKNVIKCIVQIVTISSIFLSLNSHAQVPQKMSYQAVLRNANNAVVSNTPVAIRVSVLQGSASGTAVYIERHTLTTNINGLATFEIGTGTIISGTFATINWSSGQYYVKTETDPSGGTNYSITGTSQLLSVPYALYAKTVDGISASDITNWNAAYAWGNHAGLYRPNTYVPNWSEVVNKPAFALVATSGDYNDLTNKPTTSSPWLTTGNNISNTNTGNVGIGTTNPVPFFGSGKTLTIASSGTGDTDGANLVLSSDNVTNAGQIGAITFAQPEITAIDKRIGVIYTNLSFPNSGTSQFPKGTMGFGIATGSGNQTAMVISSDSSVRVNKLGIGTDLFGGSPNAPLQFGNNGPAGRRIVLYEGVNNEHQYSGFGTNFGTTNYHVNASYNNHVFYAGSSATTSNELLRIQGNGYVGIGASDPVYKLDIAGRMRIRSVPNETAGIWYNKTANTDLGAFFGMKDDSNIGIYKAGPDWAFVMNTVTGNINIGNNIAQTHKLNVEGSVKANSFISATTTYPDYVFENYYSKASDMNKEYKFKSLYEIESFIKQNHHLEGYKAINELKKDEKGNFIVNTTEQSLKNQEKIEELYLHTIELNKKIDQLETLVQQLLKDKSK